MYAPRSAASYTPRSPPKSASAFIFTNAVADEVVVVSSSSSSSRVQTFRLDDSRARHGGHRSRRPPLRVIVHTSERRGGVERRQKWR
eukprot:31505-Pelagococcus_subviridis.AAC.10